jgi:eukaryotic-like serine/threonine-protein kinase
LSFLEIGQVVGRFEVLEVVGEGGMAVVYRVRHETLHSTHALKVLDPILARDQTLRQRFLTEGRIQARLKHPNIVAVTDVVVEEGVAGLVAEFVDGVTLSDWIETRGGTEDLETIRAVFLPILSALDYAHKQGVVHRDVKPSNIILETKQDGTTQPKLLDFGIAKVLGNSGGRRATRTGARLGTMHYMSPEQVRGASDLDARSDVFSVAATLQEFVTGAAAFDGESEFDIMREIVEGGPAALPARVDPVVRICIERGLHRDLQGRLPSCAAFADLLCPAPTPTRGRGRRAPILGLIGCLGASLLAGVLFWATSVHEGAPSAAPAPTAALTPDEERPIPTASPSSQRASGSTRPAPVSPRPTPRLAPLPTADATPAPSPDALSSLAAEPVSDATSEDVSPDPTDETPSRGVPALTPPPPPEREVAALTEQEVTAPAEGPTEAAPQFEVRVRALTPSVFAGDEVVVEVTLLEPPADACSVVVTWWDRNDDPRLVTATPATAGSKPSYKAAWAARSMATPSTRFQAKATCGDRWRRSATGRVNFIP